MSGEILGQKQKKYTACAHFKDNLLDIPMNSFKNPNFHSKILADKYATNEEIKIFVNFELNSSDSNIHDINSQKNERPRNHFLI